MSAWAVKIGLISLDKQTTGRFVVDCLPSLEVTMRPSVPTTNCPGIKIMSKCDANQIEIKPNFDLLKLEPRSNKTTQLYREKIANVLSKNTKRNTPLLKCFWNVAKNSQKDDFAVKKACNSSLDWFYLTPKCGWFHSTEQLNKRYFKTNFWSICAKSCSTFVQKIDFNTSWHVGTCEQNSVVNRFIEKTNLLKKGT